MLAAACYESVRKMVKTLGGCDNVRQVVLQIEGLSWKSLLLISNPPQILIFSL